MTSSVFGFSKLLNEEVQLYTITNENKTKGNILSIGAALQSLYLPWSGVNSKKDAVNVVLGYDCVEDYESNECYIGVCVGRVAGRICNGCFTVGDTKYNVTINNSGNCIHGGSIGLSRKNWSLVELVSNSVTLKCSSVHMEEGFPGDMEISIKYTLHANNSLIIDYSANVSGHACPINLTNHSYFNLSGIEHTDHGIRDHIVQIHASKTLELDNTLLPTGQIVPLQSQLDLRHSNTQIGKQIPLVGGNPKGFDNFYIFDQVGIDRCQATVTDGVTKMSLYTDQVGVQFYTANFFDHVACSGGHVHRQYGALCLEAQNYPDAINHDNFPSVILRPGEKYAQKTMYKFEKV